MTEGFTLEANEIVEAIHEDLRAPGCHLRTFFDSYRHADFDTGMTMVHDPVDRAVVVFVGSRDEADAVAAAVRKAIRDK